MSVRLRIVIAAVAATLATAVGATAATATHTGATQVRADHVWCC